MKTVLLLLISISLLSCQKQDYYPDPFAYRDPDLIGTWRFDVVSNEDSAFYVYTAEGYSDCINYVDNAQMKGFTGLGQIWQNIEAVGEDGWGKIYRADNFSHWTKRRSENEDFYRLSESKDTLFLSYVNLETKKANKDNPNIYIRNDFQLIYDGPVWVCVDSTEIK